MQSWKAELRVQQLDFVKYRDIGMLDDDDEDEDDHKIAIDVKRLGVVYTLNAQRFLYHGTMSILPEGLPINNAGSGTPDGVRFFSRSHWQSTCHVMNLWQAKLMGVGIPGRTNPTLAQYVSEGNIPSIYVLRVI